MLSIAENEAITSKFYRHYIFKLKAPSKSPPRWETLDSTNSQHFSFRKHSFYLLKPQPSEGVGENRFKKMCWDY